MKSFKQRSSSQSRRELFFAPASPKLLHTPVMGSVEVYPGYPPRIRFGGTLWRFKVCDSSLPATFSDRQLVTIIGLQGNCLLIRV
jgi:hypothetical protein